MRLTKEDKLYLLDVLEDSHIRKNEVSIDNCHNLIAGIKK